MALHQDDNPGIDESYVYTADDERIVVINNHSPPTETWYLRDLDGLVLRKYDRVTGATTWSRDTVHRQGTVLATSKRLPSGAEQIRYAHTDHLGTIRLWTRPNKVVDYHLNYTAFGEEIVDMGDQDHRYTGHERDIYRSGNSGDKIQDLDYMHARHCSPVQGRFLTTDPIDSRPAGFAAELETSTAMRVGIRCDW